MSDRYSIAGLVNLLKLVVGRGRVLTCKDSEAVQYLQVQLSAKELPTLRRLGEFGLSSRPPKGSDAIAVFIGGYRNNGVIIATGNQTLRLKLENDGEVALYDGFGKSIWFKKDGGIVVEANGQPITVNNAHGVEINTDDTVTLNAGGADVNINMDGGNVIIDDPGEVQLAGAGGKKVVLDGDPVVGGFVQASSTVVTAK